MPASPARSGAASTPPPGSRPPPGGARGRGQPLSRISSSSPPLRLLPLQTTLKALLSLTGLLQLYRQHGRPLEGQCQVRVPGAAPARGRWPAGPRRQSSRQQSAGALQHPRPVG